MKRQMTRYETLIFSSAGGFPFPARNEYPHLRKNADNITHQCGTYNISFKQIYIYLFSSKSNLNKFLQKIKSITLFYKLDFKRIEKIYKKFKY